MHRFWWRCNNSKDELRKISCHTRSWWRHCHGCARCDGWQAGRQVGGWVGGVGAGSQSEWTGLVSACIEWVKTGDPRAEHWREVIERRRGGGISYKRLGDWLQNERATSLTDWTFRGPSRAPAGSTARYNPQQAYMHITRWLRMVYQCAERCYTEVYSHKMQYIRTKHTQKGPD